MSTSSPWTTLSIPPHSSRELIRAQYKRLALQYHPDKNPGDRAQWATEKMTELSLAYERAMKGSVAGTASTAATTTAAATTTTTTTTADAPTPHPPHPPSLFSYATPPLFANQADEKDQWKGKKTTATTRKRATTATTRKRSTTTTTGKRSTTTTTRKRSTTTTTRKKATPTTTTTKKKKAAAKPTPRKRTTTTTTAAAAASSRRKKKTPDQDPAGEWQPGCKYPC